jgi:hypothetical protein
MPDQPRLIAILDEPALGAVYHGRALILRWRMSQVGMIHMPKLPSRHRSRVLLLMLFCAYLSGFQAHYCPMSDSGRCHIEVLHASEGR